MDITKSINQIGITKSITRIGISIISALALAYIVGRWLFNKNIQHGPDSNDVKKDLYYDAHIGCYKMAPVAHICPFGR